MKLDSLIQCILTTDFLTSTSPNSSSSSPLPTRSAPFSVILRKRGRPPRYNNQSWKNTRYTKTRQIHSYKDCTRKPRRRKTSHKNRQNVRDTRAPTIRIPQNHQGNTHTYTVGGEPGAHPGRSGLFEPRWVTLSWFS